MQQDGWDVWSDRGLLINPDPIVKTPELADDIQHAASTIPDLIAAGTLRTTLDRLPVQMLPNTDYVPMLESWYRTFAFLATVYVHTPEQPPARHIPAGIALPLVDVAARLERPPILSYCGFSLNNWRRRDPAGDLAIENLDPILRFTHSADEAWFTLIHVAIEAQAACALEGICLLYTSPSPRD